MKTEIKASELLKKVEEGFAVEAYQGASPLKESGELWNFCKEVISNPTHMNCIIFANEFNIPPVKSLMKIYEIEKNIDISFEVEQLQSQQLGALMGYIFKNILGYKKQKRGMANIHGIKTASRFYEGDKYLFT
jgi:hypothetical protein